jgi:uncharacterized protein (TIGR03067 family)
MRRRILTATGLAVLFVLPVVLLADDAPKAGDKDLEASWEVKSVVHDGKEQPTPPDGQTTTMTFKADSVIAKTGDKGLNGTFKVDASKKPRTIDVVHEDGPDKGKKVKGIYEVKDDELRVCVSDGDKDRPTEFSAKEGSGWILITAKRVKK